MTFSMEIAGHTGAVTALFDSTPVYFRQYLSRNPAEFSICVHPQNLVFEQAELDREAREDGFRLRQFTDPFLERAAVQRAFAEYLFDRNVLMLHGSAVALDGRGYLFTAPSGTGKSTHTRLWRESFPGRCQMINDDKPFLAIREDGATVYGSPWSGKHGLDSNIAVPLMGICFLERGSENTIHPLAPEAALPLLLKYGYCPMEPDKAQTYRHLVEALSRSVPLWHMTCTKDPQAAQVAAAAMSASK